MIRIVQGVLAVPVFISFCILGGNELASAAQDVQDTPDPYQIFESARERWRIRPALPYADYRIEISASKPGESLNDLYSGHYHDDDRSFHVNKFSDFEIAHPHVPRGINFDLSIGIAGAGISIPLSKPEQSTEIIGIPQLSPRYSFGIGTEKQITEDEPSSPEQVLKTLANVKAVIRRYEITLGSDESIEGFACRHLFLRPISNPNTYRLRQLWVDKENFTVPKFIVKGNFTSGDSLKAEWLIKTQIVNGAEFIKTESALSAIYSARGRLENLRFAFNDIVMKSRPDLSFETTSFVAVSSHADDDVITEPSGS